MKNEKIITIPTQIVQEADNLSKDTGLPFRDCLEVVYKAYLAGERLEPALV